MIELFLVADAFINIPTSQIRTPFSYLIPAELGFISRGWRVLVSFGKNNVEAFVVSIREVDEIAAGKLKSIAGVLDEYAWFDEEMLATAEWVSEKYLCSPAEAMRLFIPGKAGLKAEAWYEAAPTVEAEDSGAPSPLLQYLRKELAPVRFSMLRGKFTAMEVAELGSLAKNGLVLRLKKVVKTAKPQFEKSFTLNDNDMSFEAIRDQVKKKSAQLRIVDALIKQGTMTAEAIRGVSAGNAALKALQAASLVRVIPSRVHRDSYSSSFLSDSAMKPSPAQAVAIAALATAIEKKEFHSFLLEGITGSGKTEVYLAATAAVRAQGRQVLVLIPEIAQTHQTVKRFKARFGDDVIVSHSRLSVAERNDTWERMRHGEAGILVGARSALFASANNLGLIIIDEEHEFTYKQEEAPFYHARESALARGKQSNAVVLLGSATPSMESFYFAQRGDHERLILPTRVDGAQLPDVQVVDMRAELKAGHRKVLSRPLGELLTRTLERGEQAILLLNRRGYSTFISCRECGYVARCSHCEVPMVYHMDSKKLLCHYCKTPAIPPVVCPACGSKYIRYFGAGTQKLEEELQALLPGARIARMDKDTTSKKHSHDQILKAFAAGEYDILLGTQMVAKGHDVKNVTAVGIIAADSALNLPDFRAGERTFALILQAAGRAGRGSKAGYVVVQTYHPDHYAVRTAAQQDFAAFYEAESTFRLELGYPPFGELVRVTIFGMDHGEVNQRAALTASTLQKVSENYPGVEVMGPFDPVVAKIGDRYRLHILIKGKDLSAFNQEAFIRSGLIQQRDLIVDVDPLMTI